MKWEDGGVFASRLPFNFKATRADDPNAPVQTYFCQLLDHDFCCGSALIVECCVSLGESASLPYEPENRGCRYCSKFVHHPAGRPEGYVRKLAIENRSYSGRSMSLY